MYHVQSTKKILQWQKHLGKSLVAEPELPSYRKPKSVVQNE